MRIVNSLYPYPVLSSYDDDYNNDSSFLVDYKLVEATPFRKPKLKVKFNLADQYLSELIKGGQASFYLHIESPHTSYRKLFEIDIAASEFEIEIDSDKMRTVLEVTAFILAKTKIEQFSNPNVNEALYGEDYIFPVLSAGDPLAVNFTVEIELDEVNDLVKIPSIMKVAKTKDDVMWIDYDQNEIFVHLPSVQYDNYLNYHGIFGETLLLAIIQPALIYVLDVVAFNKGADMQDRKWFKVLEKKIESLGYSMNQLYSEDINSITLTQKILANPLERLYEELEGMVEQSD